MRAKPNLIWLPVLGLMALAGCSPSVTAQQAESDQLPTAYGFLWHYPDEDPPHWEIEIPDLDSLTQADPAWARRTLPEVLNGGYGLDFEQRVTLYGFLYAAGEPSYICAAEREAQTEYEVRVLEQAWRDFGVDQSECP